MFLEVNTQGGTRLDWYKGLNPKRFNAKLRAAIIASGPRLLVNFPEYSAEKVLRRIREQTQAGWMPELHDRALEALVLAGVATKDEEQRYTRAHMAAWDEDEDGDEGMGVGALHAFHSGWRLDLDYYVEHGLLELGP